MSLKGVELQIALPKTFEAGKLAEQEQQNVINGQEFANNALQKQLERNRTAVLKSEKTAKISEDDPSDPSNKEGNKEQHEQKKERDSSSFEQAQHPFKGHFVDFSG